LESVYDELDDVFGLSAIDGILLGVKVASEAIMESAIATEALRKALSMRRSELLMLHAAEIGGVTLRNYKRALRRSRRNQGGKR